MSINIDKATLKTGLGWSKSNLSMSTEVAFTDLGIQFAASDLGITLFEDNLIIKGHDGKYYMFLDDWTGFANDDIYCVRSDYPTFASETIIGKIYTDADIRVWGGFYDAELAKYYLYVYDKTTDITYALWIAQADFPSGAWTKVTGITALGGGGSWRQNKCVFRGFTKKMSGLYVALVWGFDSGNIPRLSFAYSHDPLAAPWQILDTPVFGTPTELGFGSWDGMGIGNVFPLSKGWLVFYEGTETVGGKWRVGTMHSFEDFRFTWKTRGSPQLTSATIGYANPHGYYFDAEANKLYLPVTSTRVGEGQNDFKDMHIYTINIDDIWET